MKDDTSGRTAELTKIYVIGAVILLIILVGGTVLMGQSARDDTEKAVHTVSLLYLDELAGRREQVVENNLKDKIDVINIALDLMTEEDLSDKEHMEAYQTHIKQLFTLDKFAFVDEDGLIYTSTGYQDNIDEYGFDYRTISEPEISVYNLDNTDKQVIIAVPVEGKSFDGKKLKVCFMAIDMDEMLAGASMSSSEDGTTFCNIYTNDGVALSNTVLGGLGSRTI